MAVLQTKLTRKQLIERAGDVALELEELNSQLTDEFGSAWPDADFKQLDRASDSLMYFHREAKEEA